MNAGYRTIFVFTYKNLFFPIGKSLTGYFTDLRGYWKRREKKLKEGKKKRKEKRENAKERKNISHSPWEKREDESRNW